MCAHTNRVAKHSELVDSRAIQYHSLRLAILHALAAALLVAVSVEHAQGKSKETQGQALPSRMQDR